jgi:predicted secreted protein/putative sterol carrier protein
MSASELVQAMLERANSNETNLLRLKDWNKIVKWVVGDEEFLWSSAGGKFRPIAEGEPGFVLRCSEDTLSRIVKKEMPFFMAVWGTGDIQFEGGFGDAYRLGYVFMEDRRARRVIFVSHCWLNINTRFPQGAAFEGANTPLIDTLLQAGLGIIQMPCPEYEVLGLEKYDYGEIILEPLRERFREVAEIVLKQIKDYLALGFEIVGILGMNPSPSCGVDVTKGKGTMLGTDRDTSEVEDSGIFIDELKKLLKENGLEEIPIFAVRRLMPGEPGIEERVAQLKEYIK